MNDKPPTSPMASLIKYTYLPGTQDMTFGNLVSAYKKEGENPEVAAAFVFFKRLKYIDYKGGGDD